MGFFFFFWPQFKKKKSRGKHSSRRRLSEDQCHGLRQAGPGVYASDHWVVVLLGHVAFFFEDSLAGSRILSNQESSC